MKNPLVGAARLQKRVSQQLRPQVTSLPDPKLSLGMYLQAVETRVGAQRTNLGIRQTFPTGGKLRLRGEIADRRVEEAGEDLRLRRLEVTRRLRKAYYEYWYNRRARSITKEMMDLVVSGEQVARTRYSSGRGGQEVLIKAQVELGVLEDRVHTLEEIESTYVEIINALLDRNPGETLGDPDLRDLEETELIKTKEELFQSLKKRAPELRKLSFQAQRKSLEKKLEQKARIPDITAGINWVITDKAAFVTPDNGKDPLVATIGINLPFRRRRYRAAARARELERLAIEETAEGIRNALEADLEGAYFRYQDGRRKLNLYRDSLVPKGRQSLEATFASFQSGRASFLDLLDAERILLDFELSYARGARDHLQAIADIERIVGTGISQRATKSGKVSTP
jgi:outer membrane protein TolC